MIACYDVSVYLESRIAPGYEVQRFDDKAYLQVKRVQHSHVTGTTEHAMACGPPVMLRKLDEG